MKKTFVLVSVLLLVALVLAACGGDEGETVEVEVTRIVEVEVTPEGGAAAAPVATGGTLETVRDRGVLICANNATLPGFGFLQEDGTFSGFDWDFCRAVAVAALGDADAVEGRPTTATERFPVLQSGEADVLIRNTTYTANRDTALGFDFVSTTFYDGQGMMVRKDSGITD
ncbi:MAG: transporter substrate-binding domain-containing protein, partial [Chloroflexota bacterium]